MIKQNILCYTFVRHLRFESLDHHIVREHLRLSEGGSVVDLKKSNRDGLPKRVIVTVNGLVNMDDDEISMRMENECFFFPHFGLTGPEGECNAQIGCYLHPDSSKSRYGNQGVGMNLNRCIWNKNEYHRSLYQLAAIKKGDIIRMVVKNHTLTYYHNNQKLTIGEEPIRLVKGRDYKFAVGLDKRASVRIVF